MRGQLAPTKTTHPIGILLDEARLTWGQWITMYNHAIWHGFLGRLDLSHGTMAWTGCCDDRALSSTPRRTTRQDHHVTQLTIMSVNLHNGAPEPRWSGITEQVRAVNPHVLMLQEAVGWADDDGARLAVAQQDLGMVGGLAPSRTGFHTGVLVDPAVVQVEQVVEKYAHVPLHGCREVVVRLHGVPEPVVLISAQLTPYSAFAAADEARLLVARAHRQRAAGKLEGLGIVAGDINHVPLGDPAPVWDEVSAPDRAARAVVVDGELRPNYAVGHVFAAGAMTDVAAHLAEQHGDPTLRAITGWAGQVRTDQVHVTAPLVPAVTGYRSIDMRPFTDHAAVVVDLDLGRLNA
jgi:endonuclease/exonuclease/phosphatase family metal-dependent hydrolase